MPKITPFLWFDSQAEEAVQFYVSLALMNCGTNATKFFMPVMAVPGHDPGISPAIHVVLQP
jgi:hypothetical protein